MQFGFMTMTRGIGRDPENLASLAQFGEHLGFHYMAVNDHIVVPRTIGSAYPYSPDGTWPGAAAGDCLDVLTVLPYLAAVTSTIRLLTAVLVVPYRQPVVTAKQLATIDIASRGRLTVGCGVGWMAEEFDAVGAPAFRQRGAVTDDYLQAFRAMWSAAEPAYTGDHARVENLIFSPPPAQPGGPPLWIGGESTAALRRAAGLGDGWYPVGSNPKFPLIDAGAYRTRATKVHEYAEAKGRNPDELHFAYSASWPAGTGRLTGSAVGLGGENADTRLPFSGSRQEIQDDIAAWTAAGVGTVVVAAGAGSLAEAKERLEHFADAAF